MKKFKAQFCWLFLLSLSALLLVGCNRSTQNAAPSDAHGYICGKCKFKFFTENTVYASICPSCKAQNPLSVSQLTCPKDHKTWIFAPTEENKCPTCGAPVETGREPQAKELQAWGAVKKAENEVIAN